MAHHGRLLMCPIGEPGHPDGQGGLPGGGDT